MSAVLLVVGLCLFVPGLVMVVWSSTYFYGRSLIGIYRGLENVPEGIQRDIATRYVAVSKALIWCVLLAGGVFVVGGTAIAAARFHLG